MEPDNFTCQLAQAQIGRYLLGDELPEDTLRELEEHISTCESCKDIVQQKRASLESMLTPKPAPIDPNDTSLTAAEIDALTQEITVPEPAAEPVTEFAPSLLNSEPVAEEEVVEFTPEALAAAAQPAPAKPAKAKKAPTTPSPVEAEAQPPTYLEQIELTSQAEATERIEPVAAEVPAASAIDTDSLPSEMDQSLIDSLLAAANEPAPAVNEAVDTPDIDGVETPSPQEDLPVPAAFEHDEDSVDPPLTDDLLTPQAELAELEETSQEMLDEAKELLAQTAAPAASIAADVSAAEREQAIDTVLDDLEVAQEEVVADGESEPAADEKDSDEKPAAAVAALATESAEDEEEHPKVTKRFDPAHVGQFLKANAKTFALSATLGIVLIGISAMAKKPTALLGNKVIAAKEEAQDKTAPEQDHAKDEGAKKADSHSAEGSKESSSTEQHASDANHGPKSDELPPGVTEESVERRMKRMEADHKAAIAEMKDATAHSGEEMFTARTNGTVSHERIAPKPKAESHSSHEPAAKPKAESHSSHEPAQKPKAESHSSHKPAAKPKAESHSSHKPAPKPKAESHSSHKPAAKPKAESHSSHKSAATPKAESHSSHKSAATPRVSHSVPKAKRVQSHKATPKRRSASAGHAIAKKLAVRKSTSKPVSKRKSGIRVYDASGNVIR